MQIVHPGFFFILQVAASADSCELKDEKARVQLVHSGSPPLIFFPLAGISSWQEGVSSWQVKVSSWLAGDSLSAGKSLFLIARGVRSQV